MRLQTQVLGDVALVGLSGELDSHTAPVVQAELDEVMTHHSLVLLDASEMTYLSSAGLRVLLLVYREAQRTGTQVVLAGLVGEVYEVMVATGFADFFTIVDTVQAGKEVLGA